MLILKPLPFLLSAAALFCFLLAGLFMILMVSPKDIAGEYKYQTYENIRFLNMARNNPAVSIPPHIHDAMLRKTEKALRSSPYDKDLWMMMAATLAAKDEADDPRRLAEKARKIVRLLHPRGQHNAERQIDVLTRSIMLDATPHFKNEAQP